MQIEKQLASLEQSKLLVEASKKMGVELPESYFGWVKVGGKYRLQYFEDAKAYKEIPAYSVAELGDGLPYLIWTKADIHCEKM